MLCTQVPSANICQHSLVCDLANEVGDGACGLCLGTAQLVRVDPQSDVRVGVS